MDECTATIIESKNHQKKKKSLHLTRTIFHATALCREQRQIIGSQISFKKIHSNLVCLEAGNFECLNV